MSEIRPAPVQTQTPPAPLSRALDLLDGLILRTDVPTAVCIRLGEVFDDLVDVRPPYPPTTPTGSQGRPWPAVADEVAESLRELVNRPDPAVPPAVVLRHALALRSLRDVIRADGSTGGTGE